MVSLAYSPPPTVVMELCRHNSNRAGRFHLSRATLIFAIIIGLCIGQACLASEDEQIVITHIAPLALCPGRTTTLTFRGSNLGKAVALWTSLASKGEQVLIVEDESASGLATFDITLPADTPSQIAALRVYSHDDCSTAQLISVDRFPTVHTSKASHTPDSAQFITLPVAIDGTTQSGKWNYLCFKAKAGTQVSADVLASRIGSTLDPVIQLSDAEGNQIVSVDDTLALGGDAHFSVCIPSDGQYLLRIRDIRFYGGDAYRYRIRIGQFALPQAVYPLGASTDGPTKVSLATTSGEAIVTLLSGADPTHQGCAWLNTKAMAPGERYATVSPLPVVTSGLDAAREVEGNNTPGNATKLALPCSVHGQFASKGDRDWFAFEAVTGQYVTIRPHHGTLGVPTRLHLSLFDSCNQRLISTGHTNADNGLLEYEINAPGRYYLLAEELHGRAGSSFSYRIELNNRQYGFSLHLPIDRFRVPHNGVIVIDVKCQRTNYKGSIQLAVETTEGRALVLEGGVIESGKNQTQLHARVPATLAPGKAHVFHIWGTHQDDAIPIRDSVRVYATSLDSLRNPFGVIDYPPRHWRETFGLAVGHQFPSFYQLATEYKHLWIPAGQKQLALRVSAERLHDFDGSIELSLSPHSNFVTAKIRPIEKGQNSSAAIIRGTDRLTEGSYPITILGQAVHKHQPETQSLEPVNLHVGAPFILTLAEENTARDDSIELLVSATWKTETPSEISLSWRGLPDGARATGDQTIPADKTEAQVVLHLSEGTSRNSLDNVQVKGRSMVEPAPLEFFEYRQSLGDAVASGELRDRGVLREAESFDRGNVIVDNDQYGAQIGIISDPGSQANFSEYDIQLPAAGRYQLELRYAAAEPRPGRILVNGKVVNTNAMSQVTGTWMPDSQRWFVEGQFAFTEGANVVRLESHPMMSHIDKLLVVQCRPQLVIEADFDSWVVEGSSQTAGAIDGNMISVFASDGLTNQRRIGLLEFDLAEARGFEIESVHLELAVDGRDSKLANGPVHSFARLFPPDCLPRKLTHGSYGTLETDSYRFERFGSFSIGAGQSRQAGAYEVSHRTSKNDLRYLLDRVGDEAANSSVVIALEAQEDGSETSRDWGANDMPPKGTIGGPLPPRLVFVLMTEENSELRSQSYSVLSSPLGQSRSDKTSE